MDEAGLRSNHYAGRGLATPLKPSGVEEATLTDEGNPFASPAAERQTLAGAPRRELGGWLYALILYLVVAQPIGAVQFLVRAWPVEAPFTRVETILHSTTMSLKALLGIALAALLFLRRSETTLLTARVYFLLMALLPLLSFAVHVLLLDGPSDQRWNLMAFIVPGLWCLYLSLSVRVAETYGPAVGKGPAGE